MSGSLGRIGIALCLAGTLVLGAVLALAASPGAGSNATRAFAATPCGDALLQGGYGVRFEGTSRTLGRFASVSLWTFDSRGAFTATETYNSEVSGPKTRSIAGTYRVAADCTFGLFFPSDLSRVHDAVGVCVLVDAGKAFYCVDNEDGWVTLGTGTSVSATSAVTGTPTATAVVPEATPLLLFGSGLLLLGGLVYRARRR